MPAAQVIDLSPIPNRSGAMFGEGFADRYIEKDRQQQNNKWFEDAIGDEQDPLQQAAKLSMSKHPLDPEYVKEKRKQLFENAEALQILDQQARQKKKEADAEAKEARSLEFLETQMGLQPGALKGANPATIQPFALENAKQKTKNKDQEDRKKALIQAYPETVNKLPKDALDAMDDKQLDAYIKQDLRPSKSAKTPQQLGEETFYKNQGKEASEAVSNAKKKLTQIRGNKETISRLRELNDKLKGAKGYANIARGGKEASEFNALGHSLVKVPLEIFNPTGPVGVRKLEQLKEIYAITASERHGTIQGKLKAAEWMNDLSEQAAKEQLKLYEKYNGFPPQEELDKFNQDFERAVIDPALEQSFQEGAEQMVGGFYSTDGKPLKPMPKSKAMDLLEKGLITHELK